jgi:signal transduction histidine kinase
LYLVALKETQRRAVAALAGSLLVVGVTVLLSFVGGREPAWGEPVLTGMFVWLWSVAGWAAGFVVRARRAAAVRDSAHRADQALADERLRIARELHDVVAHSMSLIAVKAAVGNHVAGERPDEARDALRVIEATSRDALVEMRRLLGVLRSGKDGAELGPAPGPGGLADLARRAELGGVAVDLDVHGAGDLPEGVGLSLYRIVQESLTNVVKHAAGARCRVAVGTKGTLVRIEVTDDGPGGLPRGSGHGLIGMRERLTAYGGRLTAGPQADGGFQVRAELPVPGPAA